MHCLVLSTSLNPESRSRRLARRAHEHLAALGADADLLDLAALDLPYCDGADAYGADGVVRLRAAIERADAILVALGIYNYGAPAITRAAVELAGDAWRERTVGFACAAGGQGSYMSVMPFANSLMLDYRCVVVPRFVYATGEDFRGPGAGLSAPVEERLERLAAELLRVGRALRDAPAAAGSAADDAG